MKQSKKQFSKFLLSLLLPIIFLPGAAPATSRFLIETPLTFLADEPGIQPRLSTGQIPEFQAETQPGTRLISASAEGLIFKVRVPWEQLSVEPIKAGYENYVRVSLPDWSNTSQTGAPALPFQVETIGAPFGVDLSVQVEPGPSQTIALPSPPLPASKQKVYWLPPSAEGKPTLPDPIYVFEQDTAVYSAVEAYPGSLAEVTNDGILRHQRVAGIALYPLHYHPATRELTVYESLRVEVKFKETNSNLHKMPSSATPSIESNAYEQLFKGQLLNYETARQWRQPFEQRVNKPALVAETSVLPWEPPDPGWRVSVREDGFYKISYSELLTAGFPVDTPGSLNPQTFKLFNLGSEVAIYVEGQSDGSFDENDYILFYGQSPDSKYSADNVYWLTYGGDPGLRMGSRDGTPYEADIPAYYPARQHVEQNSLYLSNAPGDDELERWFWDYIYPPSRPSRSFSFTLAAPYASPATLRVAMLGYLQHPINPDHHVTITLNDTQVGEVWWDGIEWQILEMPIPQDLLLVGNNTIQITCPNDTGVETDVVYIDWIELDYANTFLAGDSQFAFNYEQTGTWKFQLDGFDSDQVAVYDVNNPGAVEQIEGISLVGSGPFSALFQEEISAPTDYWALTNTAYRTVHAIEQDTASNLASAVNGADFIVITHQDFSAESAQLSDYRASQGLRALLVEVQDIYDEFGYGIPGAGAIKNFLAFAYNKWQPPAPSQVVLVGDGHYDPKDYAGYGRVSYLPPYLAMVDPSLGETAADNRYVALVGEDTMPDMMLGRLAVNSSTEASVFVNKILAYEGSPESGDWQQQVLAVADNADSAGVFDILSDDLLTCCLPEPYQPEKVYYLKTHLNVHDARSALLAGINTGKLIVNYIGHGSVSQWANEALFKSEDVAGLTNGNRLPVMLPMTCMEGYFIYPFASNASIAEVITRTNGKGAVASWSATGFGNVSGHEQLNKGFFEALFQSDASTLGAAADAGKLRLWSTGINLDLLDTYLLFGDPALRIPVIPIQENFNIFLPLLINNTESVVFR